MGISASDLAAVITRFRDRATSRGRKSRLESTDSGSLSVLYRVRGWPISPIWRRSICCSLVDVIEKDPNLKVLNVSTCWYHEDIAQSDLYKVLEEGPLEARSWLIQNIVAIAAWAGVAGLEPRRHRIVPGHIRSRPAAAQEAEFTHHGAGFYDAFLPTALTADSLRSDDITERTARVALATFRQPARCWCLRPTHAS